MRTMYDSVNPARIPRNAEMVAGYVNGPYQWADTDWALFPNAVHVGIAVRASYNGGEVLDVETGDAAPMQAPDWVLMRRAAGVNPTIYCSESLWTTVAREFNRQGVVAPNYWIAHYDGWRAIPIGAVAKQYQNTADWDISSVADYWPGVDLILSEKEIDMAQGYKTSTLRNLVVPCNGLRQLFVEVPGAGTGEAVDGHAYFVRDTPAGVNTAAYAGDVVLHIDADRPGPVPVPAGTRAVSLYYTASADFAAWCA